MMRRTAGAKDFRAAAGQRIDARFFQPLQNLADGSRVLLGK